MSKELLRDLWLAQAKGAAPLAEETIVQSRDALLLGAMAVSLHTFAHPKVIDPLFPQGIPAKAWKNLDLWFNPLPLEAHQWQAIRESLTQRGMFTEALAHVSVITSSGYEITEAWDSIRHAAPEEDFATLLTVDLNSKRLRTAPPGLTDLIRQYPDHVMKIWNLADVELLCSVLDSEYSQTVGMAIDALSN